LQYVNQNLGVKDLRMGCSSEIVNSEASQSKVAYRKNPTAKTTVGAAPQPELSSSPAHAVIGAIRTMRIRLPDCEI